MRIEIPEGLHIYDDPVPTGMISTTITIDGPDGSVTNQPKSHQHMASNCRESTNRCRSGTVLQTSCSPFTPPAPLVEVEDGVASIGVEITIRHVVTKRNVSFLERLTLHLEVPIGPGAMPNLGEMHGITGETVKMDSMAHMKRLVERKRTG